VRRRLEGRCVVLAEAEEARFVVGTEARAGVEGLRAVAGPDEEELEIATPPRPRLAKATLCQCLGFEMPGACSSRSGTPVISKAGRSRNPMDHADGHPCDQFATTSQSEPVGESMRSDRIANEGLVSFREGPL
jgi:hypothetical protein